MSPVPRSWLLLVHQVPPKPDYLRVKIRRRLQGIGSLPLKSTVYVLPDTEACREDFAWVAREIHELGGEAVLSAAQILEGVTDAEIEDLFRQAREADFGSIAEEARAALEALEGRVPDAGSQGGERALLARLKRRLTEVVALDFFEAEGRVAAERGVADLEQRLTQPREEPPAAGTRARKPLRNRTWVTRQRIGIDRMASAWLVRRFIDPGARFRFVPAQGHEPRRGELRFDMFDGEFTHEGDRCTFEVLLERFGLRDAGLRALAEIVHDLDLKDGRFGRPEAAGVGRLVAGIAAAHERDEERLARAEALFDDLLQSFAGGRRQRRRSGKEPR